MSDEIRNDDGQVAGGNETAPQAPGPAQASGMPGPAALASGMLFSPSATFAKMEGSRWFHAIAPILVLAILAALTSFTFMKRVDMEQFTRDQLRHNRFASKMTDAQIDEAVSKSKEANPYLRSAFTLPGTVVWLMLVALLYWAVFLAMGGTINYAKSLVVVAWAQTPYWINSVLATAMYFIKNPNEIDPMNPVLSNPAAFFEREQISPWLQAALSSLDLFSIWVLVLYIIGFAIVGKVSKGTATAVLVGIFILKIVAKAAFGAVFSV